MVKLTVIPGGKQPHEAPTRPDPATVRSERTGQPADMLNVRAYPLLALCAVRGCGRLIRLANFHLADWEHTYTPAAEEPGS